MNARSLTHLARTVGWGAVAMIASAGVAFACEKGSQTDIAFWNSIKDSKSRAEIQAYLDTCPSGTFVALARIRLRGLGGGGSAPPRRTTNAQPQGGLNDPTTISRVQNILFNLNYSVKRFDGQFDKSTRDALRDWQRTTKQPATGRLSQANFNRLQRARIPKVWGALAYNAKGASGVVWKEGDRRTAMNKALSACKRRSKKNRRCNVLTAANDACGALAFYFNKTSSNTYFGSYAAIRPTLGQAITSSLQSCAKSPRSGNKCGIRITFCANGSHKN
ncbi:MAG: DUF4189 domain-containing protein [Pseudomonadota bacterium]